MRPGGRRNQQSTIDDIVTHTRWRRFLIHDDHPSKKGVLSGVCLIDSGLKDLLCTSEGYSLIRTDQNRQILLKYEKQQSEPGCTKAVLCHSGCSFWVSNSTSYDTFWVSKSTARSDTNSRSIEIAKNNLIHFQGCSQWKANLYKTCVFIAYRTLFT